MLNAGLLTFINCYDVKETSKMQNIFMFAKIGALMIIIAAGLIWLAMGKFFNQLYFTVLLLSIVIVCIYYKRTYGKLCGLFPKHDYRSWQNRSSFLFWHILLFWMELLEFYDGGIKKSLRVRYVI
jgi:hypothetical protein